GTPAPNPDPAPPNASAVETAIWFASQQLGERYELGGAGPDVWDCSGLTRAAYAAAGIGIGTHSATNQYYTLAGRGKAVSLGSVQRGDLLFWGGGGSYYHVAIYLGGGRILEAPDYGKPVREWPIWGSPSAAARPAG
ncbi:MAG TPA: NlpC/P60 family protein, partial [Agromyces sp.]